MDNIDKQIIHLADEKIAISAHNIEGWKGQYSRMIRYYERTINAVDDIDRLDFALTFFQNCFHLKEWIQIMGNIEEKDWEQKWKIFISNNDEMKICRDISNISKHLKLSQKPSIDKDIAIFREYDPFHEIGNGRENEWKIFVNGKKYSLPDLMISCINSWNRFIVTEKLNK